MGDLNRSHLPRMNHDRLTPHGDGNLAKYRPAKETDKKDANNAERQPGPSVRHLQELLELLGRLQLLKGLLTEDAPGLGIGRRVICWHNAASG